MDLRTTYIVDATQAISNLTALQAAFNSTNRAIQGSGAAGTQAFRGTTQGAASATSATQQAASAANNLTVSWQTLTRVVATQAIVATLGSIRRGFADAVSEAAALQEQVALINTLQQTGVGPNNLGGTDFQTQPQVQAELLDISNDFGLDAVETAEAAYNALSNQVGTLGETLTFTREATQLAIATNSSLTDSVDLLSAAQIAFGRDVSTTGELSSAFFAIIDEGRITASELSNTFGRIGAPANELGVDFNELGSAIANISQQGFRTSETLTQFRGIVTGLSRPTPALSAAIRDLGFESAQAAVQSIGLVETLRQLQGTTEGNAEAFFDLFPNVRGSTGVLALLSQGSDTLSESFNRLQSSSATLARERATTVLETDANVLNQTLNRLQNELIGVGTGLLETGADFVRAAGGAEEFVGLITTAVPAMAAAATAIGSLLVVSQLPTAFAAVVAALNPVTLGLLAAGAAAAVFTAAAIEYREARLEESIQASTTIIEDNTEAIQANAEAAQLLARNANADLTANSRAVSQRIAEAARDFASVQAQFGQQNEALRGSIEDSLDSLVSTRQQFVNAIQNVVNSTDQELDNSSDRVAELRAELVALDQVGANPAQQVTQLLQQASQAAREGRSGFNSDNADDNAQGVESFEAARAAAQEALSVAESTGNRQLAAIAANDLRSIIQQQLIAERGLTSSLQQRRAIAEDALQTERDRLNTIREAAEAIVSNSGTTDASGREFSDREIAARNQIRLDAFDTLRDNAFQADDLQLSDILGVAQLGNDIRNEIANNATDLQVQIENDEANIANDFGETFRQFAGENQQLVDSLQNATGRTIDSFTDLQTAQVDVTNALRALNSTLAAVQTNTLTAQGTDASIPEVTREIQEALAPQLETIRTLNEEFAAGFGPGRNIRDTSATFLSGDRVASVNTGNTEGVEEVQTLINAVANLSTEALDTSTTLPQLNAAAMAARDALEAVEDDISANAFSTVTDRLTALIEEGTARITANANLVENQQQVATNFEENNLNLDGRSIPEVAVSLGLAANAAEDLATEIRSDISQSGANEIPLELQTGGDAVSRGIGVARNQLDQIADAVGVLTIPAEIQAEAAAQQERADNLQPPIPQQLPPTQIPVTAEITVPPEALQNIAPEPVQVPAVLVPQVNAEGQSAISQVLEAFTTPRITPIQPELSTTAAAGVVQNLQQTLDGGQFTIRVTPQLVASGGAIGRQFGGPLYLQNGTTGARGVDAIPALLAPGESVINSRDTSRFFSQIQAINAGQNPSFRQNSGNTTVGDINVNLTTSQPINTQQGRTLARAIRQEFRRGTSSL